MKQAVFQFLVLVFAFLVAIGLYAVVVDRELDRYDLFDFFRGEPLPEKTPGPAVPQVDTAEPQATAFARPEPGLARLRFGKPQSLLD